MKRIYRKPLVECILFVEEAMMLPGSVTGGTVKPPSNGAPRFNNNCEENIEMSDVDFSYDSSYPTGFGMTHNEHDAMGNKPYSLWD
ncbi:MAG: hypothetical protein SOZ80_02595 [Prevotella sp.]|uniref:hypothetical protein n=1 Tax=Prevotella sp. TaxID=59823 RepID=UPI002A340867|nr:hypothetical protein [Prevotella sp.]MDD7317866.1 hypothetical protein [Prevotellaceae bacterium]MDY4019655.1 hypothetical protein [Prevotella sp.]